MEPGFDKEASRRLERDDCGNREGRNGRSDRAMLEGRNERDGSSHREDCGGHGGGSEFEDRNGRNGLDGRTRLDIEEKALMVRSRFSFDFAGVSVVRDVASDILEWKYASGAANSTYEMIRLPAGVGALGKAYSLARCIVVDSVVDDIPENERFQYPIVTAEGIQSFLAFPLLEGGRVRTVLICGHRSVRAIDDALASEIQRYAAEVFGLEASERPLLRVRGEQEGFAYSRLSQKILQAQEDERKRIARELHDGISQEVLLAQMSLRAIRYAPEQEWPDLLEKTSAQLRDVISHIGAMTKALRPPSLDEFGLAAAMRELCRSCEGAFGITISADLHDVPGLGEVREVAFYRIFQEALTNACKYSGSQEINVLLKATPDGALLQVSDHGSGFDPEAVSVQGTGFGLQGMRERASLAGDELSVESKPGFGTTVTLLAKGAL